MKEVELERTYQLRKFPAKGAMLIEKCDIILDWLELRLI